MAILAVQAMRRMRGGSNAHLILGDDDSLWVVKFRNNPQHLRVLANEMIVSRLAEAAGLTVPETSIVELTPWLATNSADLDVAVDGHRHERCLPGLHFGSKFVGGLMPGRSVDYLPDAQLEEVRNLGEFAGILALDKWTSNCDGRQAVFSKKPRSTRYSASFIDHGFCFSAGDWKFSDAPLRGVYPRNRVYAGVTGWESFSPWLECFEEIQPDTLWTIAKSVPPEWYGGQVEAIERLMEQLHARRLRVRELILAFRDSDRTPFPNWTSLSIPPGL